MASIGAASAKVYLMQKRQVEKMKIMEEERAQKVEAFCEERTVGGGYGTSNGRSNKVHPRDSGDKNSSGNQGGGWHNAA